MEQLKVLQQIKNTVHGLFEEEKKLIKEEKTNRESNLFQIERAESSMAVFKDF